MYSLFDIFSPANIILFIAILTRLSGMFVSAPMFSTFPIPQQLKIWLSAAITFLVFPLIQSKIQFVAPTSVPELTIILFKEFLIGFAIGYCANVLFIAIELGANMFSIQMGLSADMALNPMSGGSSPVITQMYTWMMTMVFISINAHHCLFSAFYNSFQAMPIGYGFGFSPEVVQQIIFIVSQIFVIALKIALPIFGVLFITDVLLGFTSKVMPQMNIFMVSIPLKIYLGLLLSIIFVRPILEYLNVLIPRFMQTIMAVF